MARDERRPPVPVAGDPGARRAGRALLRAGRPRDAGRSEARRGARGNPSLPGLMPMTDPYTPKPMDAARTSDEPRAGRDARIDGLRAEASAAVASTANTLRAVGQRYREAYADELARWQALRDELDTVERGRPDPGGRLRALPDPGSEDDPAAAAAESRADAARVRELR